MSFDRTKLPIVHFKSNGVLDAEDFSLGPHLRSLILARGPELQGQKEFGVDSDQIRISGHQTEESTDQHKFLGGRIVSRTHARIVWKLKEDDFKPRLYIEDLKSTHGTFLRYKGHTEQTKLVPNQDYPIKDADSIIIGRKVEKGGECHLPIIFDVAFSESAKADKVPETVAKSFGGYNEDPIYIDSDDESDFAEHGSASKMARMFESDSDFDNLDPIEQLAELDKHDRSNDFDVENEDLEASYTVFEAGMANEEPSSEISGDEDNLDSDEQSHDDDNDSHFSDHSCDRESEAQSEEEGEKEDPSTDLTDQSDQDGAVASIKKDPEAVLQARKLMHEMVRSRIVEEQPEVRGQMSYSAITGSKDSILANSTEVSEHEEDVIEKTYAEEGAEKEATEQVADQAEDGAEAYKHILASEFENEEANGESGIASTSVASVKGSEKAAEEMPKAIIESAIEQKKVTTIVEGDAAVSMTSVQVTTTAATKRKAEEAGFDTPEIEQSKDVPSTAPKRQIVGFRTGLAAGFVAGVIGTVIGLSSIPLSEGI